LKEGKTSIMTNPATVGKADENVEKCSNLFVLREVGESE
jgi:hypothetical protein